MPVSTTLAGVEHDQVRVQSSLSLDPEVLPNPNKKNFTFDTSPDMVVTRPKGFDGVNKERVTVGSPYQWNEGQFGTW